MCFLVFYLLLGTSPSALDVEEKVQENVASDNGNDSVDRSRSTSGTRSGRVDGNGRHLYTSRCSLQRVVGLDSRSMDLLPPQPACLEDVVRAITSPRPHPSTNPSVHPSASRSTHPSAHSHSSIPPPQSQSQHQPLVLLSSFGAYHFLPVEDAFPRDLHRPHHRRKTSHGVEPPGVTEDEDDDDTVAERTAEDDGGPTASAATMMASSTEASLVRRAEFLELFAMVKAADNVLADRRSDGDGIDDGRRNVGAVGREGVLVVRSLWSRVLSNPSGSADRDDSDYGGEYNTPSSDGPYDHTNDPPPPYASPSTAHASLNRSHTYAVSMGDTHILLFVTPRDKGRATRALR